MHRFALVLLSPFALAGLSMPSLAADLDGPLYRERDVVIERPAAPVVRERVIVRDYYYEPAEPTVRAYVPAYSYYAPRVYSGYAYDDGYRWHPRRAYFAGRPHGWHHHGYRRW